MSYRIRTAAILAVSLLATLGILSASAVAWAATNPSVTTVTVGNDSYDMTLVPSLNRAYVVNTAGNSVSVIDLSTNSVTTTISGVCAGSEAPLRAAALPDGSAVWVTCNVPGGGSIEKIDTTSNTVTQTLTGSGATAVSEPIGIAASADGAYVYVANNTGTNGILEIETATNTFTHAWSTGGAAQYPTSIAVTATDVYVTRFNSPGDVVGVNIATGALSAPLVTGGSPAASIVLNHAQSTAYVTSGLSDVLVIDLASWSITGTIANAGGPNWALAITSDDSLLFVSDIASGVVNVVQLATNSVATPSVSLDMVFALAIDPTDSTLYAASYLTPGLFHAVDIRHLIAPVAQSASVQVNSSLSVSAPLAIGWFADPTYTVSPALPAGLTLNAATGEISGAATAVQPATNYVVSATDGVFSRDWSFTLTVTGTGSASSLAATGVDAKSLAGGVLMLLAAGTVILVARHSRRVSQR